MNSVKELQADLSKIIFSIGDFDSLSKIKVSIERMVSSFDRKTEGQLPWDGAQLKMKSITSFEDEVNLQDVPKLAFDDLYPFIDDSEDDDYSIEDLLAALN